jgi:hypothetical protein
MTLHNVVIDVQLAALHTVSGGLVVTSIAGALGYIPVVVAVIAGLAATASYTFAIMDSAAFQRLMSSRRRLSSEASDASGPTGTR